MWVVGVLAVLLVVMGQLAWGQQRTPRRAMRMDPNVIEAMQKSIQVEREEGQVVLYTIFRGPYEQVGEPIGKLFALAGQKGIQPAGPVTLAYLNSPWEAGPEHSLTEIRIPVSEAAMDQAGKLGDMTDVKRLRGSQVAVMEKPEGIENPSWVFMIMMRWAADEGYITPGSPRKMMQGQPMGDYASMKTRIAMPVWRPRERQENQ